MNQRGFKRPGQVPTSLEYENNLIRTRFVTLKYVMALEKITRLRLVLLSACHNIH